MRDPSAHFETVQPRPTVLLQHDLPDGASHVDWMIARDCGPSSLLRTFRCPLRIDGLASGQAIEIEAIGDHRRAYLDYEGPISGDRGWVRRLRRGVVTVQPPVDLVSGALELTVTWQPEHDGPDGSHCVQQQLQLRCGRRGRWIVRRVPAAALVVRQ